MEALTDNRNRTAQEVRHAFTRNGGNLGETGATLWMFQRKGVIVVDKAVAPDEDVLLDLALQGGADDLADSESIVGHRHRSSGLQGGRGRAAWSGRPGVLGRDRDGAQTRRSPSRVARRGTVLQLIDALEDLEDVQNVYANFDIPEEVMASL